MFNLNRKRGYIKNSENLNNLKRANDSSAEGFYHFLFDLFKTGIIVFILALVIRQFVIQPYIVDGESMMPNYENNEYLLADKLSYMINSPKRGDVVVFKYPKNTNLNYIKRIIGLPGETVKIKDNQVAIINRDKPQGFIIDEEYIPENFKTKTPDGSLFEKSLNENEYFVLGDNREHSSDSRDWGVLPKINISGRSWLTIAKLGNYKYGLPKIEIKLHTGVSYSESHSNDLSTFSAK